jgi:hypothetical protein
MANTFRKRISHSTPCVPMLFARTSRRQLSTTHSRLRTCSLLWNLYRMPLKSSSDPAKNRGNASKPDQTISHKESLLPKGHRIWMKRARLSLIAFTQEASLYIYRSDDRIACCGVLMTRTTWQLSPLLKKKEYRHSRTLILHHTYKRFIRGMNHHRVITHLSGQALHAD